MAFGAPGVPRGTERPTLNTLLAGPILRRAEPQRVCIWLATSQPVRARAEIFDAWPRSPARVAPRRWRVRAPTARPAPLCPPDPGGAGRRGLSGSATAWPTTSSSSKGTTAPDDACASWGCSADRMASPMATCLCRASSCRPRLRRCTSCTAPAGCCTARVKTPWRPLTGRPPAMRRTSPAARAPSI